MRRGKRNRILRALAKRSRTEQLAKAARAAVVESVRQRVLAAVDAGEQPDGDSTPFIGAGFARLDRALNADAKSLRRNDELVLEHERCTTSRSLACAESLWIQAVAALAPGLPDHARELAGWQSLVCLHRGDCPGAIMRARQTLSERPHSDACQVAALTTLARAHARLGLVALPAWLDAASTAATASGAPEHRGLVQIARSELAWLAGDDEHARTAALLGLELAVQADAHWVGSELWFLAYLAGHRAERVPPLAGPFAILGRGSFGEAAAAWADLGCPYERALSLACSSRDEDMRTAFRQLEDLDMTAAARRVAARMKLVGHPQVPRGRRASTRARPGRLTDRELQVFALLSDGLRNGEIAERLGIAHRTVDHHVSSILAKTLEPDRRAAARWYRRHYLAHEATEPSVK